MTTNELITKFRDDALFIALADVSDRILESAINQALIDPEITGFTYMPSQLEEAVLLMAAHRIAYGQMFALGSQVAIAKGQPFYKHDCQYLETTPFGARLLELQSQTPCLGAIAFTDELDYHETIVYVNQSTPVEDETPDEEVRSQLSGLLGKVRSLVDLEFENK